MDVDRNATPTARSTAATAEGEGDLARNRRAQRGRRGGLGAPGRRRRKLSPGFSRSATHSLEWSCIPYMTHHGIHQPEGVLRIVVHQ